LAEATTSNYEASFILERADGRLLDAQEMPSLWLCKRC